MTDKKRDELVAARDEAADELGRAYVAAFQVELDRAYAWSGFAPTDPERDKALAELNKAHDNWVKALEALEEYDNDSAEEE